LTRFRAIADSLPVNEQIPRGIEPKKYGETRYGSRVTMSERMINTKTIYEKLQEAEVTVFSFCGCPGLKEGVSVCVSHEIMDYCVNRN
jgi:hypothetical protein